MQLAFIHFTKETIFLRENGCSGAGNYIGDSEFTVQDNILIRNSYYK